MVTWQGVKVMVTPWRILKMIVCESEGEDCDDSDDNVEVVEEG